MPPDSFHASGRLKKVFSKPGTRVQQQVRQSTRAHRLRPRPGEPVYATLAHSWHLGSPPPTWRTSGCPCATLAHSCSTHVWAPPLTWRACPCYHSGTRLLHSCVGSALSLSHAFLAQLLHSCVGSALGSDLALRAASSFFDSSAMAVSLAWRADTSSCSNK
jgi:hypothetical protein